MAARTVSIGIRASRSDHLADAISSALAQTYGDFELIVADDCGELRELVEQFQDERVRYVRNATALGLNGNARRVLSLTRGRFVGLLDDDDLLLPGFLEAVVTRFGADPTLGVVFSNHFTAEGANRRVRPTPLPEGRYEPFLLQLLQLKPVATSATVMRKDIWDEGASRFQPVDGLESGLLWYSIVLHAAQVGWPFHYIDEPLMVYRTHPSQFSADTQPMRENGVALWERFSFEDEECERLRRSELALALLSRGSMLLASHPQAARRDIDRAFALAPESLALRGRLLAIAAAHPALVPVVQAGRRLRRWFGRRPAGSFSR